MPPTLLKALPQLRAVIQWAMHAQPNKTVDIRDIRDFSLALAGFVVSRASSDFRMIYTAIYVHGDVITQNGHALP